MAYPWPVCTMDNIRVLCKQAGAWIFEHFMRMCLSFRSFCQARLKVCCKERAGEPLSPSECIFHKEKIMRLGRVLRNESQTIYRRAQAAYKIGLLAFTAGPPASLFATQYMKEVAPLLQNEHTTPKAKILLLQSVAYWCYLNPSTQKKALNLQFLTGLTSIFHEKYEFTNKREENKHLLVKFWACYVLSIMICNNIPWVKELNSCRFLKHHLQLLASEDWSGWPENFAEVLYFLIGFHRS